MCKRYFILLLVDNEIEIMTVYYNKVSTNAWWKFQFMIK